MTDGCTLYKIQCHSHYVTPRPTRSCARTCRDHVLHFATLPLRAYSNANAPIVHLESHDHVRPLKITNSSCKSI